MGSVNTIIEGLQILKKYSEDIDIAAEHDVFYAGFDNDIETVSKEDKEKLDNLGWWKDEENGAGFGIFV